MVFFFFFFKSLSNGAPFVGQQTDNFNYYEIYIAFINNSCWFLMVIISFYEYMLNADFVRCVLCACQHSKTIEMVRNIHHIQEERWLQYGKHSSPLLRDNLHFKSILLLVLCYISAHTWILLLYMHFTIYEKIYIPLRLRIGIHMKIPAKKRLHE